MEYNPYKTAIVDFLKIKDEYKNFESITNEKNRLDRNFKNCKKRQQQYIWKLHHANKTEEQYNRLITEKLRPILNVLVIILIVIASLCVAHLVAWIFYKCGLIKVNPFNISIFYFPSTYYWIVYLVYAFVNPKYSFIHLLIKRKIKQRRYTKYDDCNAKDIDDNVEYCWARKVLFELTWAEELNRENKTVQVEKLF